MPHKKNIFYLFFLFFVILFSESALYANGGGLAPLGNLWVVVVDDSKDLRANLARNYSQWEQIAAHCNIDYENDYLICANSGCNDLVTTELGSQFIRLKALRSWKSIKNDGASNNAFCKVIFFELFHRTRNSSNSYVSVINYVTLEQVVRRQKAMGCSQLFRDIYVITVTSDGDEFDMWNLDQRGLRKMGCLKNVLRTKSFLMEKGTLTPIYKDNEVLPYVRIYRYTTHQSLPQTDLNANIFDLTAQSEEASSFTLNTERYEGDSIVECYIEKVVMNKDTFFVKQLLQSNLSYPIAVQGKNAFYTNHYEVSGILRVIYEDSVYGLHYRDVAFVQKIQSPSPFFRHFCKIILRTGMAILGVLFVIFGLYMPLHRLYVIYVGDRKYVVRRGYTNHWRKNIPLLVVAFDETHQLRVLEVDKWRVSVRRLWKQPKSENKTYYPLSESLLLKSSSMLNVRKLKVKLEEIARYTPRLQQLCKEYANSLSDLDGEQYISSRMFYADWIRYEYGKTLVSRVRVVDCGLTLKLANFMAKCCPKHYSCLAFLSNSSERIVIKSNRMKFMGIIDFKAKNNQYE